MSYESGSSCFDDDDDTDTLDPTKVYTLEDFITEQEILDRIGEWIGAELMAKLEEQSVESSRRRSGPRRYIPRDHEAAHK